MRVPLVFCIIFSFFITTTFAQNGTIRGVVFDNANGELLPGVTIVVEGTTMGTITDLDGKFNLNIKPGTYNINISYISYNPIKLTGIEVKAGEVTVLDEMGLKEATFEIKAATVTANRVRNTETALTAIKRKSPNLLDGISAAKLRKTGDSDAASAMKRVTGVSVSGGKYVFVRGLGDRYTKTTLNGVDIPGLDPDRNTMQMDIFPTNVIDNLVVNKSFSADLPADFTGGLIDIGTKDFPNAKIGSISLGVEYNPNFHFNSDFVTYEGGNTDWLGFDDGTRENPITDPSIIDITSTININSEVGQQYSAALRSFSSTMAAKKEQNLMNANLGFSLGNQFAKEKVTLGYNLAFSYKSETEFYEDALDSKYILDNDQSVTELNNSDYQKGPLGISSTFIGGLGGFAVKTKKAKFRLNFLYLQNGESTAGIFFKSKNNEGSGFAEGLQHNLEYNQRQLTNLLIDGKHVYSETGWTFEWKLSPSISKLSDPDIRMTQYKIEDGGVYEIDGGENDKPARIWRELTETSATGLFHITKDFNLFGRKSKFKFGGLYTYKEREFLIETFKFNVSGIDFTGNPDELFYEENLWPYQGTEVNNGVTVEQNFYPINPNNFNANANNIAGYVKTELSPLDNLKTTLGLRVEKFEQYYSGETSEIELDNEKVLDDMDFFPEVNIIYSITSKMNLRVSFSQTIARPSFKELSYAQIEDPISGVTFNGGLYEATQGGWDGDLTSTTIQNYDLRWEMFFEDGQMVSVSGFYKHFEDPIEIVMYSGNSAVNVQPRNVGNGKVLGVETEFRLSLGSIAEALSPLSISSNLTLITSEIDRDPAEYEQKVNNARDGETIEKTRIMAGMSPYIVNAGLSYLGKGFLEGIEAGLYYNVQGESLEINGVDDRPDVYSVPFHSLNFTASKSFGGNKQYSLGIKVKNILDNKKEMVFKSHGSEDMIYQSRTSGKSFGLNFKYNF